MHLVDGRPWSHRSKSLSFLFSHNIDSGDKEAQPEAWSRHVSSRGRRLQRSKETKQFSCNSNFTYSEFDFGQSACVYRKTYYLIHMSQWHHSIVCIFIHRELEWQTQDIIADKAAESVWTNIQTPESRSLALCGVPFIWCCRAVVLMEGSSKLTTLLCAIRSCFCGQMFQLLEMFLCNTGGHQECASSIIYHE